MFFRAPPNDLQMAPEAKENKTNTWNKLNTTKRNWARGVDLLQVFHELGKWKALLVESTLCKRNPAEPFECHLQASRISIPMRHIPASLA
jgi:hypothetical protein